MRHALGNCGGELFGGFIFEMQAISESGLFHLAFHGFQHGWIGMPDVGHHRAGGAIEIAFACGVPQINALRAIQHRAAQAGLVEEVGGVGDHFLLLYFGSI